MARNRNSAARRRFNAKPRQSSQQTDLQDSDCFNERGERVHSASIPAGGIGRLFFFSEPTITQSRADDLVKAGQPRFTGEICIW